METPEVEKTEARAFQPVPVPTPMPTNEPPPPYPYPYPYPNTLTPDLVNQFPYPNFNDNTAPPIYATNVNNLQQDIPQDTSNQKLIRIIFLRKIFGTLSLQGLATIGLICLFSFRQDVNQWARNCDWLRGIAVGMFLTTLISSFVLSNWQSWTKNLGLVFLLFGCFTVTFAFPFGYASGMIESNAILYVFGIICTMFLFMLIFTIQTKFDFDPVVAGIVASVPVFIIGGTLYVALPHVDDDDSNYLLLIVIMGLSLNLYIIFLVYQVTHPDANLICQKYFAVAPDQWPVAVMKIFFGLFISKLIFAVIVVMAASGRFWICWTYRTTTGTTYVRHPNASSNVV